MEEIFRKVLENASKALASDTVKKRSVCMETPPPMSGEFHLQRASSENSNQQQCANVPDSNASKATTLPSCEQLMHPFMVSSKGADSSVIRKLVLLQLLISSVKNTNANAHV